MNISLDENKDLQLAKRAAARDYLESVKKLKRKCELADAEYRMSVEAASGLNGIDYSRDKVSTSPSADAIPNAVEKYSEKKKQLDALLSVFEEVEEEVNKLTEAIDDTEGAVIRMRYLLGSTVEDVSTALYMSEREVYRKQANGLEHLYDVGIPVEYRLNYYQAV